MCFYLIFYSSPHANILQIYCQDTDLKLLCLGPHPIMYLYPSKAAAVLHQNPEFLTILKFHSNTRGKVSYKSTSTPTKIYMLIKKILESNYCTLNIFQVSNYIFQDMSSNSVTRILQLSQSGHST